jgi:hypothetical protein
MTHRAFGPVMAMMVSDDMNRQPDNQEQAKNR